MASAPAKSVDAYIAGFPKEARTRLEALRKTIHRAVPGLAEDIRYGIPTFRWRGRNLVHIAGYAGHVGFYPVLRRDPALEKELAPYLSGAATARFSLDKPIPRALVTKLVKHRLAQLAGTEKKEKGAQSKKGSKPASMPRSARPKAKSARSSSRA